MISVLLPGTIIDGRYRLIELLGEGGMGTVYKAREIELDRILAIKFLHPDLAANERTRRRIFREGKVLSAMDHPNIIRCYRLGLWQNKFPFIVMEYLEGASLRDCLNGGPLPIARALAIAVEICNAMEVAHADGVIHRDLAPGNVFLHSTASGNQIVKVIDFGLSIRTEHEATGNQRLTQTGFLIGSLHYMSPEQCNGTRLDKRTDIYSVGCILYEMLTGSPPFVAPNPLAIVRLHTEAAPADLPERLLNVAVPQGLNHVVMRALCKSAADRYQSMESMRCDLETVLAGRGESIASPVDSAKKRQQTQIERVKQLLLVAVVALAACGWGVLLNDVYGTSRSKMIAFESSKATRFRRLRSQSEVYILPVDKRINYLEAWLAEYGASLSCDKIDCLLYLSEAMRSRDPALADRLICQSRIQAQTLFDVSLANGDKLNADAACQRIGKIRETAHQSRASAMNELASMIAKLDKAPFRFYRALIYCRSELGAYHLAEGHAKEALSQFDAALQDLTHCSVLANQKSILMIKRSSCLWRLGRQAEAVAQLKDAYHFELRLLSRIPENKMLLAEAASEQEQYLITLKATESLEQLLQPDPNATNRMLGLYEMRAGAYAHMGRYQTAYNTLFDNIDRWSDLSSKSILWMRMAQWSLKANLHKETELGQMMTSWINGYKGKFNGDMLLVIMNALNSVVTSALDQKETIIATNYLNCCCEKMSMRWDLSSAKSFDPFRSTALNFEKVKNFDRSESILRELIKEAKSRASIDRVDLEKTYCQLVGLLNCQGKLEQALNATDELIAIPFPSRPDLSEVINLKYLRVNALRNLKRFDEAERVIRECLELARKNHLHAQEVDALFLLGQNEYKQKNFERASLYFHQADKCSALDGVPARQRALVWFAKNAIAQKKYTESNRYMEEILVITRNTKYHVAALRMLALLYEEKGDPVGLAAVQEKLEQLRRSSARAI